MNHPLLSTPAIYDQETNMSWSGVCRASSGAALSLGDKFEQGHSVTFSPAHCSLDPGCHSAVANRATSS